MNFLFVPKHSRQLVRKLAGLTKWLAVFTLGIILGASSLNLLIGKNLDRAYIEIQELKNTTADQQAQIESLQEELDQRRPTLVKELKIFVLTEDKFLEMEVENIVKRLMKDLVGKEVDSLDPILVSNVLNGRIVEIDKVAYTVQVKALLISEKILIYVQPKESPI